MGEADELDDARGLGGERPLLGGEPAATGKDGEEARGATQVEPGQHVVLDAQRRKDARLLERADDPAPRDRRRAEPGQRRRRRT